MNSDPKLVHYIDDRTINLFKKGIKENSYDFYDKYKNIPEILILGRSNVGKSSLINSLLAKKIASNNKKPGKTQKLEFFVLSKKKVPFSILIDAPGFGYVNGPIILRRKFKYLIYSYLHYAVRLKKILYLINGEYGMKNIDREQLIFLNKFQKEIQLVFTKIDKLNNSNLIKYITEASNFCKPLKNIRPEIMMCSSKTKFGLDNIRAQLYVDIYSKNKLL
jgi:GTP-binding protein